MFFPYVQMIARDVAMIEHAAEMEDRLRQYEQVCQSPDFIAELRAKNDSLEKIQEEQQKQIEELLAKEKEFENFVKKSSELELELKSAKDTVENMKQIHATLTEDVAEQKKLKEAAQAELKNQMDIAKDNVDQSQCLVNRYEACLLEHKKTCSEMKECFLDFAAKDAEQFMPGNYNPEYTISDDEEADADEHVSEGTETVGVSPLESVAIERESQTGEQALDGTPKESAVGEIETPSS